MTSAAARRMSMFSSEFTILQETARARARSGRPRTGGRAVTVAEGGRPEGGRGAGGDRRLAGRAEVWRGGGRRIGVGSLRAVFGCWFGFIRFGVLWTLNIKKGHVPK